MSVKEPNCAQSFILCYFIIYSLFPVCCGPFMEGGRERVCIYVSMHVCIYLSFTHTHWCSVSVSLFSFCLLFFTACLSPSSLSRSHYHSFSLWLSLFPSFSHLLTCTHARTCTHTHKHTQVTHTILHELISKHFFFYNACIICHYLIGDKTCHSDKTCRNTPHMVDHCPNWNPCWWWWWWWWWRCYFSSGKPPAGLHK